MAKQPRPAKTPAPAAEKKAAIVLPNYPNATPLPVEKGPKNIDIMELASPDDWQAVLTFYQQQLSAQGWQQFASHQLEDRGTLSFRRPQGETLTVLAADEAGDTHIRIYIQKK